MNKRIIFLGLLLVLISLNVNAYSVGQVFSQEQLNNVDIENFGFNVSQVSAIKNFDERVYEVTFSYDTATKEQDINRVYTGNYVVTRVLHKIEYRFDTYYACLTKTNRLTGLSYTPFECKSNIKSFLINRAIRYREYQRKRLLSWQQKDDPMFDFDVSIDSNSIN